MRVGFGYDVHQLVPHRKMILGGVEIPSQRGLLGHSDADALTHAVIDALLGSLVLGDIGRHFPDTDERFAGISSLRLLEQVGKMLDEHQYCVSNIDATVVLEEPKLAPYIEKMQRNIAEALSILDSQVSVKATTNERLGPVGQGQGLAAYACVLVKEKAKTDK
ncbi:MAG: 2-C-methyl-D-erythritol 2,4-cyclodiphosphate synthase [bacterium]